MIGKIFYRYDGYNNLKAEEWVAVKETKCGWWIRPVWTTHDKYDKFILKVAVKRYAQPSKEEALKSYIARKRRQIKLLEAQAERVKEGLYQALKGLVDEKATILHDLPIIWPQLQIENRTKEQNEDI